MLHRHQHHQVVSEIKIREVSSVTIPRRQSIALLSLAHDPAPQQLSEQTTSFSVTALRSLAEALAKLGWQIDVFTRTVQPDCSSTDSTEWIAPYCRVIRLAVDAANPVQQIAQFVRAFLTFQTQEGTPYPLIHAFDDLSVQVGLHLKQQSGIRWLHTHWQQMGLPWQHKSRFLVDQHIVFSTEPHEFHPLTTGYSLKADMDRKTAKIKLGLSAEPTILWDASVQSAQGASLLKAALFHHRAQGQLQQRPSWCCLMVIPKDLPQSAKLPSLERSQGMPQIVLVPEEQRDLAYAAADLCVITSPYEPLGTAALKALNYGIPVIAPDIGAFRFTIVAGETGQLVPPGDAEAIAQAIDSLLFDEVRMMRRKRQQASWETSTDGHWNRVAAHLSDLYRKHLAALVGATNLEIPPLYSLSVPDVVMGKGFSDRPSESLSRSA